MPIRLASQLADPNQAFHIWASPLVFDGKICIGLASHCVNPCVTGRLVCVDANGGHVIWSFATAPDGSLGGAVWSSAAVDATRRMIYVGTGNYCSSANIFVGSLDHNVYAFALPGAPPPPPPPASAALTVSSPVAGEQWTRGQKYNIAWSASGGVSKVDVSISRDGGASWSMLSDDTDAAVGALQVKAKKPRSETVIIRVTDSSNPAVFGDSGMFYIK